MGWDEPNELGRFESGGSIQCPRWVRPSRPGTSYSVQRLGVVQMLSHQAPMSSNKEQKSRGGRAALVFPHWVGCAPRTLCDGASARWGSGEASNGLRQAFLFFSWGGQIARPIGFEMSVSAVQTGHPTAFGAKTNKLQSGQPGGTTSTVSTVVDAVGCGEAAVAASCRTCAAGFLGNCWSIDASLGSHTEPRFSAFESLVKKEGGGGTIHLSTARSSHWWRRGGQDPVRGPDYSIQYSYDYRIFLTFA